MQPVPLKPNNEHVLYSVVGAVTIMCLNAPSAMPFVLTMATPATDWQLIAYDFSAFMVMGLMTATEGRVTIMLPVIFPGTVRKNLRISGSQSGCSSPPAPTNV